MPTNLFCVFRFLVKQGMAIGPPNVMKKHGAVYSAPFADITAH